MGEDPFVLQGDRRLRRVTSAAVVVALCTALAACSSSGSTTATSSTPRTASTSSPSLAGVTLVQVPAGATSSAIGAPDGPNLIAVDPSARPNGELFVFLPGTGGLPRCCQQLLEVAATTGFAAIGLAYPNSVSADRRCGNDLSCYEAVRRNEFDGSTPGPASAVPPQNAIESRLASLLSYLARAQPDGHWSRFLDGARVDWSRVIIAGHSQGGGEAAYIGKAEATEGVVLLSSVVDSTNTEPPVPAPYLASPGRTPRDRYVGFDHTADPFFTKITAGWKALGLNRFGPLTSVDGRSAPYGHTHQLTTSVGVPHVIVLPEHDSTAVDVETPVCPDGAPRFVPAWRYLLQVAGGLRVTASPAPCAPTPSP
ncbi:MAG TPA: hypothetical protein VIB48_16070 [Acidimicrobiia bacterium]